MKILFFVILVILQLGFCQENGDSKILDIDNDKAQEILEQMSSQYNPYEGEENQITEREMRCEGIAVLWQFT